MFMPDLVFGIVFEYTSASIYFLRIVTPGLFFFSSFT